MSKLALIALVLIGCGEMQIQEKFVEVEGPTKIIEAPNQQECAKQTCENLDCAAICPDLGTNCIGFCAMLKSSCKK